ncbi:hypothetical protein ACIGFK_39935 [Streptomyces sp. NPDC085524]|uniref:hypothetical protein n=1 Tax=Streptomyces sp. NPDC085524 TaxID=3365728 RepID=UPI0037D74A63
MSKRIIHSYARGVHSIDIPDDPGQSVVAIPEPSQELFDRALVGWERFTSVAEKPSDG